VNEKRWIGDGDGEIDIDEKLAGVSTTSGTSRGLKKLRTGRGSEPKARSARRCRKASDVPQAGSLVTQMVRRRRSTRIVENRWRLVPQSRPCECPEKLFSDNRCSSRQAWKLCVGVMGETRLTGAAEHKISAEMKTAHADAGLAARVAVDHTFLTRGRARSRFRAGPFVSSGPAVTVRMA
jgi:hypothetical protein